MPEGKLIGVDLYPMGTKEFGPLITKIKAAKPDVVVCASLTNDLVNFLRQNLLIGTKGAGNSANPWTIQRVYEYFPRLKTMDRHIGGELYGGEQQILAIG